ncbi:hypothetical protein M5D96_002876 [Drosophila gunungcola]|uniref:Uncharacterized protein n=1 Tax=Drosophila gunungcola TaxID=103775 RepID=A0A9P9Z1A6_9MUSC|nr:hypothetical protein M5D96_002876 [Drosophila gunungcola]
MIGNKRNSCSYCSQYRNALLLDLWHKITPTYTGIHAFFRNCGGLHCKPVKQHYQLLLLVVKVAQCLGRIMDVLLNINSLIFIILN